MVHRGGGGKPISVKVCVSGSLDIEHGVGTFTREERLLLRCFGILPLPISKGVVNNKQDT